MQPTNIISARQFDKKKLAKIFSLTDQIKKGVYDNSSLKGKIMATLFYEPSTRTRFSFESAMIRLGGSIISTENAAEFSSAIKGESLEDTIRIVNFYSDLIVIRHPVAGASEVAANYSRVPIINAGDGEGEHPTQALLDLYTIFSKFNDKKITVAMIGDLAFGRTAHSLSYLMSLFPSIKIIFVSPKPLSIPQTLRKYLLEKKLNFEETEDLNLAIGDADVIYQTRIQRERFKKATDYKKYFGMYILNKKSLKTIKQDAVIMHPLPRVNEISQDVDSDKRAIYFEQAQNGLFVRMALLLSIFDKV